MAMIALVARMKESKVHSGPSRGTISRRALLASVATSALTVGFDWSAAHAAESSGDQSVLPRLRTTTTFFTDNFRRTLQWDIATSVRVNAIPHAQHLQLVLRFDRRLLSIGECVMTTTEGEWVGLTPNIAIDGNEGTAAYEIDPMFATSGERPTVGLPFRHAQLFPNDNIDDPIGPTAELVVSQRHGVTRSMRRKLYIQSSVDGVRPWALVLNPAWATRPPGLQTVPVAVRARSLGPHAAPARAGFTVLSDAETAPEPTILQVHGAGEEGQELGITHEYSGNRRATFIEFPKELPVGTDRVVRLGWPGIGQQGLPAPSLQTVVRPVDFADESRPRRRSTPYELIAGPEVGKRGEDG